MTDKQMIFAIRDSRDTCLARSTSYAILANSFRASGVMTDAVTYESISRGFTAAAERLQCALDFIALSGDAVNVL